MTVLIILNIMEILYRVVHSLITRNDTSDSYYANISNQCSLFTSPKPSFILVPVSGEINSTILHSLKYLL